MLQFSPRGQGTVQVLLLPLRGGHELRIFRILRIHRLGRGNPLVSHRGVPVDLTHAYFHLLEILRIFVPPALFVEVLQQYPLSRRNTNGRQHIQSFGRTALRCFTLIVNHLEQHLTVGHIALGHHTDLIFARSHELRFDAHLLLR